MPFILERPINIQLLKTKGGDAIAFVAKNVNGTQRGSQVPITWY